MEGELLVITKADLSYLKLAIEALNEKTALLIQQSKEKPADIEGLRRIYSPEIMKLLGIRNTKFHQIKKKLYFLHKDESGRLFAYQNDLLEYIKSFNPEPYFDTTKQILKAHRISQQEGAA